MTKSADLLKVDLFPEVPVLQQQPLAAGQQLQTASAPSMVLPLQDISVWPAWLAHFPASLISSMHAGSEAVACTLTRRALPCCPEQSEAVASYGPPQIVAAANLNAASAVLRLASAVQLT